MFVLGYWMNMFRRFALSSLVAIMPAALSADSWENAIAAVEAKSEEIWKLAEARGLESKFLGAIYNELDAKEHSCSILGRMLGKPEAIADVEATVEHDLSDLDPHSTGLAAHSLDNWVYIARRLLTTTKERRIEEWNLDCVGQMGIPNSAYIVSSERQTFYDVDGAVLRILGDVENGFAEKIRSALSENPQIRTVALGSGGGAVYEAMLAGIYIRERGLETTLYNNCYSACTILFISGVQRTVWSPYPDLQFHQVSQGGVAVPLDDQVYMDLAIYSERMGVLPMIFIGLMQRASPEEFEVPPVNILCDLGLTTWVQRICGF